MFEVGDRVEVSTDDCLDGELGTIKDIYEDGYGVFVDTDPFIGYWFGFNEVRKVDA